MSARVLEFVSVLGKGGFGSVYLAHLRGPSGFRRRVAVKVMNEELVGNADLLARQRDEARLLGLLGHDSIVQVFDLVTVGGRPAVVMEYVEGADLSRVQRALPDRRAPPRAALEAVAAAASALDAAANTTDPDTGRPLRVIHRDIKPANLFLTAGGTLKVLDFGIARADFDREGRTGSVAFGTPRFMAPEQWLGDGYDASVDVYALGVTLFELLAGRPWERPALAREAFDAQVAGALAPLAHLPEAAALVRAMTAFDAGARPTAAEVSAEAHRIAAVSPGDGLAGLARAAIPALLAAQQADPKGGELPPTTTLGGDALAPALTPALATPSLPQTGGRGPRAVLLAAGAAGVAAVGIGATGLLAGGYFLLRERPAATYTPDAAGAEEPEASGAPPIGASAAAPDVLPGAGGPPPATPPDPAPAPPSSPTRSDRPRTPAPRAAPSGAAAPDVTPAPIAPPASAAPASQPASYTLSVTTDPLGAEVEVDGRGVGPSPVSVPGLAAGAHQIVVRMGSEQAVRSFPLGEGLPVGVRYTFATGTWRTVR
jgi:hypothetical protein